MSTNTVLEKDTRQKLSFDFDDDSEETKEQVQRKIEEISERSGFMARAPVARGPIYEPPASFVPVKQRRRRTKTGRTFPFATKLREETYDKICAMADYSTEKEGRPVSLSEIVERAIDSLEIKMKSEGMASS